MVISGTWNLHLWKQDIAEEDGVMQDSQFSPIS